MRTASLNTTSIVINAMLAVLLVAAALVAAPAHAGGSGSANQVPANMQATAGQAQYVGSVTGPTGATGHVYHVITTDNMGRKSQVTVTVTDPACPQRVNCLREDPAAKARAARWAAQNALNRN